MNLSECIAGILDQCDIDSETRSKIIIEVRDFESSLNNRLSRIEEILEEVVATVDKHTSLLIGRQKNGDFDFGLIYRYEELRKKLNWVLAGVWSIVTLLLAGLIKILFFGGI